MRLRGVNYRCITQWLAPLAAEQRQHLQHSALGRNQVPCWATAWGLSGIDCSRWPAAPLQNVLLTVLRGYTPRVRGRQAASEAQQP